MAKYRLKRIPTHPGVILKEDFMIPLDLSQTELAHALKTTFRTINEIVNGKRSVSPDMALRLAKYFGTSSEVWMGLQVDYDLYKTMKKTENVIRSIKPFTRKQAA